MYWLLLALPLASASECTVDDYEKFYSPCKENKRNLVHYKTKDCVTTADVDMQLKNQFGITCNCDPGFQRPDGGDCLKCAPGSFSAAGIILDKSTFSADPKWDTNGTDLGIIRPGGFDSGITLTCDGDNCQMWSSSASGEYIHSGANKGTRNIQSILTITKVHMDATSVN
eukprot:gene1419-4108_t